MSQDESQGVGLSAGQKWIIGLTFVGTLGLSIFGKPTIAFALVGLGTLLLLHFGSEIGRVTIRLLGGEAVIERAERAEQGALKATQEATNAAAAAQQVIIELEKRNSELEKVQSEIVALVRNLEEAAVVFDSAEESEPES